MGKDLLLTYNMSDPSKIVFLSAMTVSISQQEQSYSALFPTNFNTIMVSTFSNILIIDISDLFNPFILGLIPVYLSGYYSGVATYLSDSGNLLIFIADKSTNLKFVTFKPQFYIQMPTPDVYYGEDFNNKLMLLKKNTVGRYTLVPEGYRFILFSLYNVTVDSTTVTPVYTTTANMDHL